LTLASSSELTGHFNQKFQVWLHLRLFASTLLLIAAPMTDGDVESGIVVAPAILKAGPTIR
jgi:hypothetical protein